MLTKDNRDMIEMDKYQQARIEALKRRVDELESALRFVLDTPGITFEDLAGIIECRRQAERKGKTA